MNNEKIGNQFYRVETRDMREQETAVLQKMPRRHFAGQ